MHPDLVLSPETRKDLLDLLGDRNSFLIGQIEQVLRSAKVREKPGPVLDRDALRELGDYENALRSVLDRHNALSFKAHRTLAEISGRPIGGLPAIYRELQTELRRIGAAKRALIDEPQRGAPQGSARDHLSEMLARVMNNAGQGDDDKALARLMEIVVPVAIDELRPKPEPAPTRFGLAVTEPFENYDRGKVISDPAEIAHAEKEHPGKTVRITLK